MTLNPNVKLDFHGDDGAVRFRTTWDEWLGHKKAQRREDHEAGLRFLGEASFRLPSAQSCH